MGPAADAARGDAAADTVRSPSPTCAVSPPEHGVDGVGGSPSLRTACSTTS
eukprot:gene7500-51436_t